MIYSNQTNQNEMKIKKFEPRRYMTNEMFPVSFNHLIDQFFSDDLGEQGAGNSFFRPSTDIIETDDSYEVHLSLPGLKKEDIKIELNDNVLLISGERENRSEKKENKWHLSEISYGKFSRRFQLPEQVDKDKIEAGFEDGILKVMISKTEAEKPRLINVK